MPAGGYQAPASSAAVSGPGKFAKRTDNPQIEALASEYGEGTSMRDLRQGAPVQDPRKTTVQPDRGGGGSAPSPLAGFADPTTMPDVPITDGAALGPGAGPEALGLPQSSQAEARADVASLHPGYIEALVKASMRESATPSFKRYVRSLLASR
jgi:hypothetical protein